jgi:tetratricopeptide (TPR) repeat protein
MDVAKEKPKLDFLEDIVNKALNSNQPSEYNKAIKTLLETLKQKDKKKFTVDQEIYIKLALSTFYRLLGNFETALSYAEKAIEMIKTKFGPRSVKYVMKVPELLAVYRGLKENVKIRETIVECLSIMDEFGLSETEEYGLMLKELASVYYGEKRFKESLDFYEKAKLISEKFKDETYYKRENYIKVLTNIAMCRRKLNKWNEAIKLMKEAIDLIKVNCKDGNKNPLYGISLYNLASIYSDLKAYQKALPLLEEIVAVQGETLLANDQIVGANKFLSMIKENISNLHPESIQVDHTYRLCNTCKTVVNDMDACTGCFKVYYCNAECQLKDWLNHKPSCSVCMECEKVLDRDSKILRCSACKNAKYCNLTCQLADWKDHKDVCAKSKK